MIFRLIVNHPAALYALIGGLQGHNSACAATMWIQEMLPVGSFLPLIPLTKPNQRGAYETCD